METRFARPQERDLRFVRNSGFRSEDFGQEVRIADSFADAVVLISLLAGVLAMLKVFA